MVKKVPQNGGDLGARRRAQESGERNTNQGQDGLELLHNVGEELIGEDSEDGGHQNNLECAQSQTLQTNAVD